MVLLKSTFCLLLILGLAGPATCRADSDFTQVATYQGLGALQNSLVGPGPRPDSERYYQSYFYIGGQLEIVSIDPATGDHNVFSSPVQSEQGAWALSVGPDGNIYAGTLPNAHILRLNPSTGQLVDMGRPSSTETYIWQFAVASDKKIYGGTFPSAKLVRFNPTTQKSEDLGRMDDVEQYARSIAADDDGFVYLGIGFSKAHLVAYEIATGLHRDILPKEYQLTGVAAVWRGDDGMIYGQVKDQYFRLEKWRAIPIPIKEVRREVKNRLRDGRSIEYIKNGGMSIRDKDSDNKSLHPFHYTGEKIFIRRLGLGPDGVIYGSPGPIHFFRLDPRNATLQELGDLGPGRIYSFVKSGKNLLFAAYSGSAPLFIYDPAKPFSADTVGANPIQVKYEGQNDGWRPKALIVGPDNKIYIGSVAGYGELDGPLTVWDSSTNSVEIFHSIVQNQSVVSLTEVGGLILGATSVSGGGGSQPTENEAKLFAWDPAQKRKLFEISPVVGAKEISDLITAPNGLVYGIAGNKTLFSFELESRKILYTKTLPFQLHDTVYNCVALGPDKKIWGLAAEGIFTIDPQTNAVTLIRTPKSVTAGFALKNHDLYYASGPDIYRYQIPNN